MFAALVPGVRRLLEREDVVVTLVDVGGLGGVEGFEAVAERVVAHCFEPNPATYRDLIEGAGESRYRELTYHPYAIADRDGDAELFVTRGPGMVGLLEPNLERLRELVYYHRTPFATSFGEERGAVVGRERVEVRTLATFARDARIDHVDYLKADVEGSEYEVLEGAGDLLARTGVVRAEVSFVPFRHGQKLFGDVDRLLRDRGFDLVRYEIAPEQVGYKERRAAIGAGAAFGYPDPYGQALQADAVYVNRGIVDRARVVAQAVALVDRNFLDEAAFVLRRAGVVDEELLTQLRTHTEVRRHERALAVGVRVRGALAAARRRLRG